MAQLTLAELSEVFLPFETVKTGKGKIVYSNKALNRGMEDSELLTRYSYVSLYQDSNAAKFNDKKIFFAERYGGDGILNNGGGARCGFDGVFQLKGVGLNKLLGVRTPDVDGNSHANGLLCLNIAIYESIWAEIIQRALPYGAVGTVAIIDLEIEFEESNAPQARALLVRLPAVRPAHFIRAMYFKEKKHDSISEDAKRVNAAIHKLVSFLPEEKNHQKLGTIGERLNSGIEELATRYAKQFATARSKRIFHSNVSASNITIDGAWLDLSRSSVFSERLWWDGFDLNNFTGEYAPAINSIREMCFYLSKYGVISLEESSDIFKKALSVFSIQYEKSLYTCNAVQIGFPLCIIEHLADNPLFLDFSQKLRKVLAEDKYTISTIRAGSWIGYEHGITRFYMQLLRGKYNDEASDLSWVSGDDSLLSQIVISYGNVFELVASEAWARGVNRKNLTASIAINLTRLNRCNSVLLELSDEIVEAIRSVKETENISQYKLLFEKATLAGSQAFKYDEAFSVSFWENELVLVKFDAATGLFNTKNKKNNSIFSGTLDENKHSFVNANDMFLFYEDIMDFL
jgi:hypothetical protein